MRDFYKHTVAYILLDSINIKHNTCPKQDIPNWLLSKGLFSITVVNSDSVNNLNEVILMPSACLT
jgi:hypothetical protein